MVRARMAGRRSWLAAARNVVVSMGWWCLILLAIAGSCRGVLAAAAADSAITAMEPTAAVAHAEDSPDGGCYRPLSDVIWGFLVTLLALTVSMWGSMKHREDSKLKAAFAILYVVLAPLDDLGEIIENSLRCVSLLWNCHKIEHPSSRILSFAWLKFLFSSLIPWSKSPARILASCDIVVYVSTGSALLENRWMWWAESSVKDESEAMVVGENGARAIRNHKYKRMRLSEQGLGLLLWREVFFQAKEAKDSKRLPKYDELKYLRGNSGFAIIATVVQALGYIYAVGFRIAKDLRTPPLEVIGLIFNTILLFKVLFYSTCNRCHRPLVIYMDGDWVREFEEFKDEQTKFKSHDSRLILAVIGFGIFVGLNTLLIYCIVHIVKATNVMVMLPAIIFLIGLSLEFLGILLYNIKNKWEEIVPIHIVACVLVNAVAYIWATIGTIKYWRSMHFNTRPDLINLSQIIPFIG